MNVDADTQTPALNPLQQQDQTNPSPGNEESPAMMATGGANGPHPPSAGDTSNIGVGLPTGSPETIRILSKTFGHIPGVPIFTHWGSRRDCSNSGVHRPVMAGIWGNGTYGTYSVAVSGRYMDDEDGGDTILYTGAGGRKKYTDTIPIKRLRIGPQTEDQSWLVSPNNALKLSFYTRNPVRVIRSSKCRSKYAPLYGYRYDGLYTVAACWTANGRNGKKICRCRLERLPGQPPIPERPITISASSRRWAREPLVSRLSPNSSPSTTPPSTDDTDSNTGHSETGISPGESEGGSEEMSVDLQSPPQQQAVSGADALMMTGEDLDVKVPQTSEHQRQDLPGPSVLPTYRWDPKKRLLVELPSRSNHEDDERVVPSEDGRVNERETPYFSDAGK